MRRAWTDMPTGTLRYEGPKAITLPHTPFDVPPEQPEVTRAATVPVLDDRGEVAAAAWEVLRAREAAA